MSHLVTVTKHFWSLQAVTSRFLAFIFRDITLNVVNNHRIARTLCGILICYEKLTLKCDIT